jgi:hypothetical protein
VSKFLEIPTPEQQKNILFSLQAVEEDEGEYLVTTNWWKQWCDYVNIEFKPFEFYISINFLTLRKNRVTSSGDDLPRGVEKQGGF